MIFDCKPYIDAIPEILVSKTSDILCYESLLFTIAVGGNVQRISFFPSFEVWASLFGLRPWVSLAKAVHVDGRMQ